MFRIKYTIVPMSQLQTKKYFNQSLDDWIKVVHTELCALYNYPIFEIVPTEYGYGAYESILCAILPNITTQDIMGSMKNQLDMNKYLPLAHDAWSKNYIHWKGITPAKLTNNPLKSLNTNCRNDRATTHVNNLADIDSEMYNDVITIVFDNLSKKILEVGMRDLSI